MSGPMDVDVFRFKLATRTEDHVIYPIPKEDDRDQFAAQFCEQLEKEKAQGREKLYVAAFESVLEKHLLELNLTNVTFCLQDQMEKGLVQGGLVVFSEVASAKPVQQQEQQQIQQQIQQQGQQQEQQQMQQQGPPQVQQHGQQSSVMQLSSAPVELPRPSNNNNNKISQKVHTRIDGIVRVHEDHDLQLIRRFKDAVLKFHKPADQEADFSEHLWSRASFAEAIRKADAAGEALKLKVTDRVAAYNTLAVVAALMSGFGLAILIEVQFASEGLQGTLAVGVSFLLASVASMNIYGLVVLVGQIYFAQRLAVSNPAAADDFLGRSMERRQKAMFMVFWSLPLFALATALMCLHMAADSDLAITWFFPVPAMLCLVVVSVVAGRSNREHSDLFRVAAKAHEMVVTTVV